MQVMHDDDNNITICTALYQSSGFFIIMSPAEGLHFSALVITVRRTTRPGTSCLRMCQIFIVFVVGKNI